MAAKREAEAAAAAAEDDDEPWDPITVYGHSISQPCRSVIMLCEEANITYTYVTTDPFKGQARTKEFLSKNISGKIPVMEEADGWTLSEGAAILAYLCNKHSLDQWYPTDVRLRARVDAYMHWHHGFLRRGAASLVFYTVVVPSLKPNVQIPPHRVKDAERELSRSLKLLDTMLTDSIGVAIPDRLTIADLFAVAEVAQLDLMNYDLTPYKTVKAWLQRCRKLPSFSKAHAGLYKMKTRLARL